MKRSEPANRGGGVMQAEHLPHVQRSWGRKKPDMINDEKKHRKDGEKHRKDGLLSKRGGPGRAGIGHGKEVGFYFILNEALGFQRALRRELFCKLSPWVLHGDRT